MKIYKVYLRNILIKLKLKGPKSGYIVCLLPLFEQNGILDYLADILQIFLWSNLTQTPNNRKAKLTKIAFVLRFIGQVN